MDYTQIKPILIIAFNRPNKIYKIVELLNDFENLNIFISIDGPRNKDDIKKIDKIENIINILSTKNSLIVNRYKYNLGCSLHCSSAINWFFNKVEMGIIIEDDINIKKEFLYYCSRGLEIYRKEKLIFGIAGSPYFSMPIFDKSDFLSIYPNIWGWATWKERWNGYSLNLKETNFRERFLIIKNFHENFLVSLYWFFVIELFRTSKVDGWDHQMYFLMWKKNSYFLIPSVSYTENIGFDNEGTYMIKKPEWYQSNNLIDYEQLNLTKVKNLYKSLGYDKFCEKSIYRINFINILKLILKWIIFRPKIKNYDLVKYYH